MRWLLLCLLSVFAVAGQAQEPRKVVIIGSGPAAYTAAIYCARARLAPLIFEGYTSGISGGQLMTTTEVENFPGFPEGIAGPELMGRMKRQAERFGAESYEEDVVRIDCSARPFVVHSPARTVQAHSIIIATGSTAKRLDIPGTLDGELWQNGVSACAICDGALPVFREKPLFVIGGGDSAVEEALFLTRYASKVYIVYRKSQMRASKIMVEKALSHPRITLLANSVVKEVKGDKTVESVVVKDLMSAQLSEYEAEGLFFAVGHEPNTAFVDGELELDNGYIALKKGSQMSSVEGIFAAGDVHDPVCKQAITAAGTGCRAALELQKWLSSKGLDR